MSGFGSDLRNAIAEDLDVRTQFVRVDSRPELFETISAVRSITDAPASERHATDLSRGGEGEMSPIATRIA